MGRRSWKLLGVWLWLQFTVGQVACPLIVVSARAQQIIPSRPAADLGSDVKTLETRLNWLQNDLAERDREIGQLRDYARQALREMAAARAALNSAEREKAEAIERAKTTILRSRGESIDFKVKQQEELAAREKELISSRNEIIFLKSELEKRTKETKAAEVQGQEQLVPLRSRMEKLEGSIAQERKEREKAGAEAERLEGEKRRLETELGQAVEALRRAVGSPQVAGRSPEARGEA